MTYQTIEDVLTRPNPELIPFRVGPGQNTISRGLVSFDNLNIWEDFNYETLRTIFGYYLDLPFPDPPSEIKYSELDRTFSDEDGFEHQILSRDTIPLVTSAFLRVKEVEGWDFELNLNRRARCGYGEDSRINPDWALVKKGCMLDGKFKDLMPGDSKVHWKWKPNPEDNKSEEQHERPIQQVLVYGRDADVAFYFILTTEELVVYTGVKESIGPGLAAMRPIRARSQGHQQSLSDATEAMSISSEGNKSYEENYRGLDFQEVKYQVIPWSNYGRNRLSVGSGLFILGLMAGLGINKLRSRYPKLNTWWRCGNGFKHNTSGVFKKTLVPDEDEEEDPYIDEE